MPSRYLWSLALLLIPLSPALAQRADSTDPRGSLLVVRRADSLRHQIEERFASRVQEQLGLTNEQTAKLRTTSQKFGVRRRELQTRERRVREALSGQLQPGVAANQDSVAKLTDAVIELKLASVQNSRDEMRELSKYLTPVQRARLFVMRERFDRHVKEAHGHRGMGRHRHRDRSWM